MIEKKNIYRNLAGKPDGKRTLYIDIGGMIILKWIVEK
jgi:hypothetical protein